jgi:hypothetical protein
MVSPGTTFVAETLRRLAAPDAPREMATVPLDTEWVAEVVLVNVAKVPSPAIDAVVPMTAIESRTFLDTCFFIVYPVS